MISLKVRCVFFFQRFLIDSYDEAAAKDYRPRWVCRGVFLRTVGPGAAGTFPSELECGVSGA
jgi:hypothetical protein